MDRPPIFAPAALLAAASAWTLALTFGQPTIGTQAASVVAVDLLIVSVTAIIAMVVARSRWSRRLALATVGTMALLALTMSISTNWIVALLLSGLALMALTGPSLDEWLRPPAPDGPPPTATLLPLILLFLPAITAYVVRSPLSPASWVVIVSSPLVAWAYGKGTAAGLWAARTAVPAALVATVPGLPWWSVAILCVALVSVIWTAWSADAVRAIRPIAGQHRSLPIPAELTPPEVLAAAGLDQRGRPIHDGKPRSGVGEDD